MYHSTGPFIAFREAITRMNGRVRHRFTELHPWRIGIRRAGAIQRELSRRVETSGAAGRIQRVAGVDVGFEAGNVARAAVVVLSYPDLAILESRVARRKVSFPYVPGYLSFREVPAILSALARLIKLPDLILCDGQGYAHPRRFGLACHLGVVTGIATVGVAKSRLIGSHHSVGPRKGQWAYLQHAGERIGIALRTRDRVNPLFVSIGHRVSLAQARRFTLTCCTRYRLPETTRAAHRLASGR